MNMSITEIEITFNFIRIISNTNISVNHWLDVSFHQLQMSERENQKQEKDAAGKRDGLWKMKIRDALGNVTSCGGTSSVIVLRSTFW